MAPITFINQIRYLNPLIHDIANAALNAIGETLLTTQTVGDMLFGYEDKFLKEVIKLAKEFRLNITIPSDVVGLFIGVILILMLN